MITEACIAQLNLPLMEFVVFNMLYNMCNVNAQVSNYLLSETKMNSVNITRQLIWNWILKSLFSISPGNECLTNGCLVEVLRDVRAKGVYNHKTLVSYCCDKFTSHFNETWNELYYRILLVKYFVSVLLLFPTCRLFRWNKTELNWASLGTFSECNLKRA